MCANIVDTHMVAVTGPITVTPSVIWTLNLIFKTTLWPRFLQYNCLSGLHWKTNGIKCHIWFTLNTAAPWLWSCSMCFLHFISTFFLSFYNALLHVCVCVHAGYTRRSMTSIITSPHVQRRKRWGWRWWTESRESSMTCGRAPRYVVTDLICLCYTVVTDNYHKL